MRFAPMLSAALTVTSFVVSLHAVAQTSMRQKAPTAASQPAPAAAGPLRILLVDDDFSDNNNDPSDKRQTPSDRIFRQVVADAVGGNPKSWEIEYVKPYASGPGIERLRPFSLIVWYTGSIYGGNPDNTGVLSIEDEKTVRRYLEEVGGTVILFSPGYLSKVLGASGTWEKTDWKFLTEVVGLRGGVGLAQRFLPGTVTAPDGVRFNVDKGSSVESQFSLANPARATVLFSTVLASAKPGSAAAPVATSHAYGKGRFIYVGFSFENLAAAEHAPVFGKLLAATGLRSTASPAVAAATAALVTDAPRTFTVTGRGRDAFNFSASSAGAIRVQVQSQGAPVTVSVLHPDGRKVERSGSEQFAFDDLASDADVAKGHIWGVTVRATTPTAATSAVASGVVVVSHPPSDQVAVTAQLDTLPSRTQVLKTTGSNSATLKPSSIGTVAAAPAAQAGGMATVFKREDRDTKRTAPPPPPPPKSAPPPPNPVSAPDPLLRLDKLTGSPGTPLKASGQDLFPPGTRVQLVMDRWGGPDYYNAALHFVFGPGNSQLVVAPMAAQEIRHYSPHPNETETDPEIWYLPVPGQSYFRTAPVKDYYERWYTGVVPTIPVPGGTPVSVFLRSKDGRSSNRLSFTYQPQAPQQLNEDNLHVWYADDQFTDATLASSYPNVATNATNVNKGRISRDTLLLGFSGHDTFHNTKLLQNGWTVKECVLFIHFSVGSGAEITECRKGTNSPFVKVRWYLEPTFIVSNELTYSVQVIAHGAEGGHAIVK